MYPGNKLKAITFSFDDGVEQDVRLIALFNKYHLKGTFNLNSGIQTRANSFQNNGVTIHRLNMTELPLVYQGHEVAVHTLTHPHLENLDRETIINELIQDKRNLENCMGYPIRGMAYPYGSHTPLVNEAIKACGLSYARDTRDFLSFSANRSLIPFSPTCHYSHPDLMDLARQFAACKPTEPMLFYVWGHSYEFDVNDDWSLMEEFLEYVSGRNELFYGTNAQVLLSNG